MAAAQAEGKPFNEDLYNPEATMESLANKIAQEVQLSLIHISEPTRPY